MNHIASKITISGNKSLIELYEKATEGRKIAGHAVIETKDIELVKHVRWWKNTSGHIMGYDGSTRIVLSKLLMRPKKGQVIHWRNGKVFDCRRKNMELITYSQRKFRAKLSKNNTSGVKGVSWISTLNRYRAYIGVNGKKHIKDFEDLESATAQRNAWEEEFYGDVPNLGNHSLS